MRRAFGRWSLVSAVAVVVGIAAQGCVWSHETAGEYFGHRYRDFTQIGELGITVTSSPQVGLYFNSFDIFPIGYSNLDGYFVGLGANRFGGITRHRDKCWGFGYGEEIIGWGPQLDTDKKEDALIKTRSGLIGIFGGDLTGNGFTCGPEYSPACVHFFPHIAYVGLAWNLRFGELADFLLGWFGLDIAGDDGYPVGKWSFPRRDLSLPPI